MCLPCYVCSIFSDVFGTRFKATYSAHQHHFSVFSMTVPCLVSGVCPSSNTTACFRSCHPHLTSLTSLSQLTGWHTYQRTKSLSGKTEENACMHIRSQVHTWSNNQTQSCTGGQEHISHRQKKTLQTCFLTTQKVNQTSCTQTRIS